MSAHYTVTAIAPRPSLGTLAELQAVLSDAGVQVVASREQAVPRSLAQQRAARTYLLEAVPDPVALRLTLDRLSDSLSTDFVLQAMSVRQADFRMAVFDMDSTLIQCEVIDELAHQAGVGEAVAAITERAMRGELDFASSFTERLGKLAGLSESRLADIAAELPITEGMPELITTLRGRGIYTVILSGGFTYFAQSLQERFGFDEYHANALEIERGQVTGRVASDIVDGQRKRALLESIATARGLNTAQVIAVGDGANDLPMLGTAGMGIAFDAKPVVRQQASYNLRHVGLDGVLYLMGCASEVELTAN